MMLILLIVAVLHAPGLEAEEVNPCIALKLPLCRVNSNFASKNGITTTTRPTPRPRRPTLAIAGGGNDQEPKSFVPTPKPVENRFRRPLSSASDDKDDSACAGLILCKLSKNASNLPRRTTAAPEPEVPDFDESFFNEDLMSAVLNGHIETAKELIEDGADVNAEDVHGNSVLHIAAQNGRAEVIDDLLLKGADVNKGNNHKNTALHLAAQNGWTEIARKLLRHRKIIVDFADLHANTALHLAAQNGQLGVLQLLIEAGANVNKHNTHKHTPLHLAAQNGHLEGSKMLVENGADPNYPDLIGNTPLHTAVHTTHSEIAQMLIRSGGDVNKKNLSGLTPFQLG